MASDASPFTSPHRGASPVLSTPPCVLGRFLSLPVRHNKPYLGLRVKSRKQRNQRRKNMQFSRHNPGDPWKTHR